MEVTQIYVEQVIIGAMVVVVVAVLAFGPISLPDDRIDDVVGGIAFIGIAYVAGILYDRIADSLLERLERRQRFAFAVKRFKPEIPLKEDPFRQYGKKLLIHSPSLPYLQSRMRILRALATLVPVLALALLTTRALDGSSWRGDAAIAASGIYLLTGLACAAREFPTTRQYEKLKWPMSPAWLEPSFFGFVAMTLLNLHFARGSGGVLIAIGGAILTLITAWAWLRVYITILNVIAEAGNAKG